MTPNSNIAKLLAKLKKQTEQATPKDKRERKVYLVGPYCGTCAHFTNYPKTLYNTFHDNFKRCTMNNIVDATCNACDKYRQL